MMRAFRHPISHLASYYYATLEFPYGTSLGGVPDLEAIGQEVRPRFVVGG